MAYYAAPFNPMPLTAITANTTFVVPAGWAIDDIFIINTTANAVTGGIRIGTTDGGVDVVVAFAVAGSLVGHIPEASMLKRFFSSSVDTTLYLQTVTLWNSASLNLRVVLKKVF
jgi:hypothetical protein